MSDLLSAAEEALTLLKNLHPDSICCAPENCPHASTIKRLEVAILDERGVFLVQSSQELEAAFHSAVLLK